LWAAHGRAGTLAPVVGDLVKRLFNAGTVLLASLTFFLLPVGGKTPAQHAVAIFTTEPARHAATAFSDAAKKVVAQATGAAQKLR
jgi:hypothetical protein